MNDLWADYTFEAFRDVSYRHRSPHIIGQFEVDGVSSPGPSFIISLPKTGIKAGQTFSARMVISPPCKFSIRLTIVPKKAAKAFM